MKKEDMIKGRVYCLKQYEICNWIIKFEGLSTGRQNQIDHSGYITYGGSSSKELTPGIWSSLEHIEEIREASDEEINWLEDCMAKQRFVSKPSPISHLIFN